MRSKWTNIQKNLTKRPYIILLYSAGSGAKYQTAYEIMKNMKGNASKDVYRMLKELAPGKYVEDELLLNFNEVSTNIDNVCYKRKLIQKINRIFDLEWQIGTTEKDVKDDNSRVRFEIEDNGRFITIYHDSNNALAIKLERIKQYGFAKLTILTEGKPINKTLIVKRIETTGKINLYTTKHHQKIVRYLTIDLKDKAKKSISEIRNQIHAKYHDEAEDELRDSPEILEVENNRDNWIYRLNFRGLLTFLAGESKLQNLRKSNKEIRDVISKEWIVEEAPFLEYWQYFEKSGFDVIGLLRRIGSEFKDQVTDENIDRDYLFIRVLQRYYNALSSYFCWLERSFFLEKNKDYVKEYHRHEIGNKLHIYRPTILKLLRTAFTKEIETIDKMLKSH